MLIILYIFIGIVFICLIFYGIKKYGNPIKLKVNKKAPDLVLKNLTLKVSKQQKLKLKNDNISNLKIANLVAINSQFNYLANSFNDLNYEWNNYVDLPKDSIDLYGQSKFTSFIKIIETIVEPKTHPYLIDFLNLINQNNVDNFLKNYEIIKNKFNNHQLMVKFILNNYPNVFKLVINKIQILLIDVIANLQHWKDYSAKYLISYYEVWEKSLKLINDEIKAEWETLFELEFGGYL